MTRAPVKGELTGYFSSFLLKTVCCGHSLEKNYFLKAILMSTHNLYYNTKIVENYPNYHRIYIFILKSVLLKTLPIQL